MAYITIREYGEDSFIEKKSEFIGYAKRVENEEEAKAFVAEIKSKHKQARHNCWAYIIGENMGIQRYSDDGEPQGTAGCLLYTSPSPRDRSVSRMPSSA